MRTMLKLLMATLVVLTLAIPVLATDKPAAGTKPAGVAWLQAKAELIDINSATEAQLKALPGIGDAYARKIVAGRPYARKDQLKAKAIIPAATYDKIQDQIVATQNK